MLLVVLGGRSLWHQLAVLHVVKVLDWLPAVEEALLGLPGDGDFLSVLPDHPCFLLPVRVLHWHRRDTWWLRLTAPVDELRLVLRGHQWLL